MTRNQSYESTFAEHGRRTWRLDYRGNFYWEVFEQQIRRPSQWRSVAEGGIDAITTWARTMRHQGLGCVPLRLGIRVSGGWWKRIHALRPDSRVVGSGDGYCEEGGVGTCFVTEYQITVFAETNASGGVDLWQEKTEPFIGTDRMGLGTNYRTIEEVEAAVEAADYSVTADYDAIASLFEHLKAAQAAIDNILNQTH
jgi:hypothetical protein